MDDLINSNLDADTKEALQKVATLIEHNMGEARKRWPKCGTSVSF